MRVTDPDAGYTISKRASRSRVQGGDKLSYTLTARMGRGRAAWNMRVCDRLPRGLVFVSAPGATFIRGEACWRRRFVPAGAVMRFRVVVRAERGFVTRRPRNLVIANGPNLAHKKDAATILVTPAFGGIRGGVTG